MEDFKLKLRAFKEHVLLLLDDNPMAGIAALAVVTLIVLAIT